MMFCLGVISGAILILSIWLCVNIAETAANGRDIEEMRKRLGR